MNSDNGNILMKLIYLCMDHLMHNPKRAIVILFIIFILTMVVGELIGTMRNSEMVFSPTAIPLASGKTEDYFSLPDIDDHGPVNLTPQAEITGSPSPEVLSVKIETPSPTVTGTVSCISALNITAGKMVSIDFPGGYYAEINVRYRPEDPYIVTGVVKSGEKVYVLDGPVCQSDNTWWKINSDTQKTVGWIPEKIGPNPALTYP